MGIAIIIETVLLAIVGGMYVRESVWRRALERALKTKEAELVDAIEARVALQVNLSASEVVQSRQGERIYDAEATIADLKQQLEAKNTKPVRAVPRQARNFAEYTEMKRRDDAEKAAK